MSVEEFDGKTVNVSTSRGEDVTPEMLWRPGKEGK